MSYRSIASTLALLLTTSGCASILEGSTQTVSLVPMRSGQIDSDTTCTASNSKGKWVASGGSQVVVVEKSRQDLQVECVDSKNQIGRASGQRTTRMRWAVVNFFAWDLCTFSCLIDFSTGSIYAYPTQVRVEMPEPTDAAR